MIVTLVLKSHITFVKIYSLSFFNLFCSNILTVVFSLFSINSSTYSLPTTFNFHPLCLFAGNKSSLASFSVEAHDPHIAYHLYNCQLRNVVINLEIQTKVLISVDYLVHFPFLRYKKRWLFDV